MKEKEREGERERERETERIRSDRVQEHVNTPPCPSPEERVCEKGGKTERHNSSSGVQYPCRTVSDLIVPIHSPKRIIVLPRQAPPPGGGRVCVNWRVTCYRPTQSRTSLLEVNLKVKEKILACLVTPGLTPRPTPRTRGIPVGFHRNPKDSTWVSTESGVFQRKKREGFCILLPGGRFPYIILINEH